jgi:hypothetical protein
MALKDLELVQAGERTNVEGKAVNNEILLTIPDEEYLSVRPHLQYLVLQRHEYCLLWKSAAAKRTLGRSVPSIAARKSCVMRGTVRILNRKTLEKLACECYAVIRQLNGECHLILASRY